MKRSFKTIAFAVFATVCLAAGSVSAARPANVARTTWTLQVNRETDIVLTIDTQGGPGAPGALNCRTIRGKINGIATISGWYCPSTGRIHFVHRNLDSDIAVRVFTGNVSDDVSGQGLYMAGTVTVLISAFGDLGEYNFSATEQ